MVFKNALAYITRKKNRAFIIFLILTFISSSLYVCLSITKSTDDFEKVIYKSSNSSISIKRKNENEYFRKNELRGLCDLKNVKEYVYEYEGLAKLKGSTAVGGEQKILREDLSDDLKNVALVNGTDNIKNHFLFKSGVFTIKEGRLVNKKDRNKIMIHESFAKKNKLKLKDKVSFEFINMNKTSERFGKKEYEIVGIFKGKKEEKYTGLSSDLSENAFFTNYNSSQEGMNLGENNKIASKLTLFASNKKDFEYIKKNIKNTKADLSDYQIEEDEKAYMSAIKSVKNIEYIIKTFTCAIMVSGVIILYLILTLWLRERIYEIGVLISMGISKLKILAQFIAELVMISVPSYLITILIGNNLLNNIMNSIMANNKMPSFGNETGKAGGVITFAENYAILLIIIIVAVLFAMVSLLNKKPKEILSKIS